MGEEPSQHPPDGWNMMGPYSVVNSAMRARAAAVAVTLSGRVVGF